MGEFPEHRFLADAALGKLAKWLRILGMDARYIHSGSIDRAIAECEPERIVLTRSRHLVEQTQARKIFFVQSNDPVEQLKEVIGLAGIHRDDIRPFSRCIQCNRPISDVPKTEVKSRIPDYVWEQHHRFQRCEGCGRIYWKGSHIDRSMKRIDVLFDS